jgi:hypothetical protein
MTRTLACIVAAATAFAACTADTVPGFGTLQHHDTRPVPADAVTPSSIALPTIPANVQETLKNAADAHAALCENDGAHPKFPDDADAITRTFCQDKKAGGVAAAPTSLADLQKQLGLDFKDPSGKNGEGGNPAFAILGHSSALTARKVTPIAPTAFIFTPPPAGGAPLTDYTILAFDPGEQFVEVASYDPTAKNVNFYIVFFEQACTRAPRGCTNVDLLTPRLVTGWSNVRVYEDTTELGNTILDCHVCHQPDNGGRPFLRMQEITPPFTHWFSAGTEGGRTLLAEFHGVRGTTEDYGGIPAALIDKSDPSKLAALVTQAGFAQQPNAFDSAKIEAEVKASAPGQPAVNVPSGTSSTWQALYDRAVAGAFIATPYHDVSVADPAKVARMKAAYAAVAAKTATTLPDLRDVFLDRGLRDMGFAPKAGLDGRGLLAQMCQECHQSKLDPMLTRERFLVDQLDTMSRSEKDLAIQRLETSPEDRLSMPPVLFRTITDDERRAMIDELKK